MFRLNIKKMIQTLWDLQFLNLDFQSVLHHFWSLINLTAECKHLNWWRIVHLCRAFFDSMYSISQVKLTNIECLLCKLNIIFFSCFLSLQTNLWILCVLTTPLIMIMIFKESIFLLIIAYYKFLRSVLKVILCYNVRNE